MIYRFIFFSLLIFFSLFSGQRKEIPIDFFWQHNAPRVASMGFKTNGDLVVATWRGDIYLLPKGNVKKVKKIASGLEEPLGMAIVNDEIYVAEKQAITHLRDINGDDIIDEFLNVSHSWEVSTNFHEFTLGLDYYKGKFYTALALAINPGGATTLPQKKDRGTLIEIEPKTGEYKVIAAGLRTPNGLTRGYNHQLWVADNQGNWLPASKLIRIKKGSFHTNRYQPLHPWAKKTDSKNFVWLPQGEIGNSPTQPLVIPEGLYKGQILLGDIHLKGVRRIYIDNIDKDLFNGVVFSYISSKFRGGINRLIFGPDKMIYAGVLGSQSGGNWRASNLITGLIRFPVDEKRFDVTKVESVSDGFVLSFNQEIDDKQLFDILVEQWRYEPTKNYGGPKKDKKKLFIKSLGLSINKRLLHLKIDGLKENGHVIKLKFNHPILSKFKQKNYSPYAYITLQKINHDKFVDAPIELKQKEIKKKETIFQLNPLAQSIKRGEKLFETSCYNCHNKTATFKTGPGMKNLYGSKRKIFGNKKTMVIANEAYLKESIIRPQVKLSQEFVDKMKQTNTLMPAFSFFNKEEINDIINYLKTLSKYHKKEENSSWQILFDGSMASAKENFIQEGTNFFPNKGWKVQNNELRIFYKTGGKENLRTKKEYQDFELELEFKFYREDTNSGIFYHGKGNPKNVWRTALEFQLAGMNNNDSKKSRKRTTAAMYALYGNKTNAYRRGEWNKVRIICINTKIQHYLNNVLIVDVDTNSKEFKQRINKSKFGKLGNYPSNKGPITLQDHIDSDVGFRKIRIRSL